MSSPSLADDQKQIDASAHIDLLSRGDQGLSWIFCLIILRRAGVTALRFDGTGGGRRFLAPFISLSKSGSSNVVVGRALKMWMFFRLVMYDLADSGDIFLSVRSQIT